MASAKTKAIHNQKKAVALRPVSKATKPRTSPP
jgi:hypothetical protein